MNLGLLGRALIFLGGALVILGVILVLFNKIPFAGKLPGDILIQRKNFTVYFPLATCLLLSLIISVIFYFWGKR
ncbi:MAG: DUF2905 domain-containing protein [Candidatus Omnitrophica bacterium]|nr:DUF2905 domain-containing protein [Candidatus Omnitrophota bacterium]